MLSELLLLCLVVSRLVQLLLRVRRVVVLQLCTKMQ